MESRPLGHTGLTVTPLGLGLAALGRPGYITLGHGDDLGDTRDVESMGERAFAVLDAAWAGGVRYVDAARSYGLAESFLARWLDRRGLTRADITIGSKWGYTYTAGWSVTSEHHEVKDHTLATLERQLVETSDLLGPWLSLYQIHSATESSGVLDRQDVLDRLATLKEQGIAVGLTLSGPDSEPVLARALEIERNGRRLFDVVQATWNPLEPSLSGLLLAARQAGLGVIVKEALANGRLTHRNREPGFADRRVVLEDQAARLGCTLDQFALSTALSQPFADCVLLGAASVEQLVSNLAALSVPVDAAAERVLQTVAETPEAYWAHRSRLAWN